MQLWRDQTGCVRHPTWGEALKELEEIRARCEGLGGILIDDNRRLVAAVEWLLEETHGNWRVSVEAKLSAILRGEESEAT